MNEDLKKKNKRNNLILLVVGIVIIISVVAGFAIHNHRVTTQAAAEKFAQTHFNPNVKIDGVKVGKLTVTKAMNKVNKNAKNQVQLKNNELVYSYNTNIQTINKAETQALFKSNKRKLHLIRNISLLLKI